MKLGGKWDTIGAILLSIAIAAVLLWLHSLSKIPPDEGITESACYAKGVVKEFSSEATRVTPWNAGELAPSTFTVNVFAASSTV
jgi:hypothetical protein